MKPSDHRELWDDTLADSLPADFADEALATMLGQARKRRRRRAALKGASLLVLMMPAVFLALRPAPGSKEESGSAIVQPPLDPPAPAAPPELQIQVISDEELLAQFPGRAVAIIGSGDSKQLVFLDKQE